MMVYIDLLILANLRNDEEKKRRDKWSRKDRMKTLYNSLNLYEQISEGYSIRVK